MIGPVVLLVSGAVALYLLTKGRAAGNLTFFPGNVTGAAFEGATPVVYSDLLIQNTSNLDITVNSFAGNVTANDILVGNVSLFAPVVIYNNSQAAVPLVLRLQMIGMVQEIFTAIQTGNFKQTLRVTGSANADGVQIPIDLTFNIG